MKKPCTFFAASMKKFVAVIVFMIALHSGFQLMAQYAIDFGKSSSNIIKLTEDNANSFKTSLQYAGIKTFGVDSGERGLFNELIIEDAFSVGEVGEPKLPATKKLIEIPFGADVHVKVLNYTVNEYKLSDYGIENRIMPVQASMRKDQTPEDVVFEYDQEMYQRDAFISHELASVEVLGVLRGYRIARLTVAPVSYNPVKGIIRVYNDLEVEVSFTNVDKSLTEYVKASTFSPYFESLGKAFLNKGVSRDDYPNHPDLTKYPVKYVIVADRMFEETLQPFIAWKTKKGFNVIESYTDEVGTTYAQIQSYLHGLYNNATPEDPAPSFILLVGDVQEIPATQGSSSKKQTDLYYASVDGDYFPEMYYGRMSARNVDQLQAQIDKTLYYEQYQFEDPTYLNKATLIGGVDGNWNPKIVQPTIKYATQNYFNASQGYTDVVHYLTSPYTGCYSPERIAVSFINYTAHCGETSWGDPSLSISAVNAFTNTNKYPLAVGNCCLAADFGYGECIGEAWMRAANKGAVCYLGSSPSSYWKEDMYWAVGAFPMVGDNNGYVPTVEESTTGVYDAMFTSADYVATDAMVFLGNLALTEAHVQNYPTHSSVLYYWQAYNCLGDPSLVIYNTEGSENEVSHMAIVPIGMDTYEVTALPGSLVAISKDGVLHGSALVDETGVVQVPITPIVAGGDVDIVVTKPQYVPYMTQIPAAALEGAYIVLESSEINDETENNNGMADYGETFTVTITMKNVGTDPSSNLTISIEGENEFITLETLNETELGAINPESTTTVENVATFKVNNYVPDLHRAIFTIVTTDGTDTWESNLAITLQAPKLEFAADYTINDAAGNNNGKLDPGETATVGMTLVNKGSSKVSNAIATLTSTNPLLTVEGATTIPNIEAGESVEVSFVVTADAALSSGETVMLFVNTLAGPSGLYKANQSIEFVVGDLAQYNMSNTTVTTCLGYFYDSGGPNGDYSSNANLTMTFLPETAGSAVKATFLEFALENNHYDKLYIYNGSSTSASQITGSPFTETLSPGTIIASNAEGALTFRFTSDGTVTEPGWKAEMSCHIVGDLDAEATATPSTICYGGATALKADVTGGSGTYTYTWTPSETIEVADSQTTIASPTETTTYTVEVSDGTNTVTSDVTVTVTEVPAIEMNSYDVVLYKDNNSSFELIPTMEDAALYVWSTGETTPTITLQAADYHAGVYIITVMIANSNDCIATANVKLTVQNFVGLEDREELLLYAYPNPARDVINISVIGDSKTFDYELLNYQGQLINAKANNPLNGSAIEQMNVGNLSKGIYYLRVRTGNQLQIQKIVLH